MENKAKILIIEENGNILPLGELEIMIEPRYADGGYFIRNIVRYSKNLIPSEEYSNYLKENKNEKGRIYELYYVSDEGIEKYISKVTVGKTLLLEQISDGGLIFPEEKKKIIQYLKDN